MRSRPPWRSRSLPLVALLLLTLVLAAVLAYEAWDAGRSHRRTAERALRDYAAFAAQELASSAAGPLQSVLADVFAPVAGTKALSPYELLPSPALLASAADSALRCGTLDDARRVYFRLDFRDRALVTSGPSPSPARRAALSDTIAAHAQRVYQREWRSAALIGPGDRALVYAIKFAEHGAPLAAYGFETCASAFGAPLFRRLSERHPLLPGTVMHGAANDSLLSVRITDAAGHELYRSPVQYLSAIGASASLDRFGGLTASVTLRPRIAEALVLGVPLQSRLPLLLGLLALTGALAIIALHQLRRENELARLREDFISSVSHELRTPLAQILLYAETLSLGRVRSDDERRGAADVIVQEAQRLRQLVENVLHFSRAERQLTRLAPEMAALAPLVTEVVAAFRPFASALGVEIRTELDHRLAARVDRGALRQMLLNLLDNAAKYGPAGQTLTVALEGGATDRVRIRVDDQGSGIPVEERDRVWASFYRLPMHAASAVAGSGIGLYVVRELARLHDGIVWVESAPGGGCRVIIELPRAMPDDAAPVARGAMDAAPEPVT
ncbi:MAG: HAMP domain-containing histidine kinase [Gemmatimonadota bacterium]|nr:HAMP domain-containing histidine kinase [Gemmatimonadota bacterium]